MIEGSTVTSRDLELVAALADGRLEGRRRAEAIARVEADPALLEIYAETLARLEEQEDGDEDGAAATGREEGRRRPWALPLAAVLALVAAAVPLWRTYLAPVPLDAASLVAMTAPEGAIEHAGWLEPGWPVNRGPEAEVAGADVSFRLGVRAVDLEAALEAGAVEDALLLTERLEGLLATVDLAEPQRRAYGRVRSLAASRGVTAEASEYARLADELNAGSAGVAPASYALGKWAEAGRLTLLAGEDEPLRSTRFRRAVQDLSPDDESRAERLAEVLDALEHGAPAPRLAHAFEALIRAH